jgi:hypothetical protein
MTVGTDKGKKIGEIEIRWDCKMPIRFHLDDLSFTVEAGDQSFHGLDLRALAEKGRIHLNGWSELKWEPVISIDTEIYSEISISYSRFFRSKHKGQNVYRRWKFGDVNEDSFGSRYREGKISTGDRLDGGEPGAVMGSRGDGRILPYTHDRWTQLRELSKKLREAMDKTAEKLSEMLKGKDIDSFLEGASGLKSIGLDFKEKV